MRRRAPAGTKPGGTDPFVPPPLSAITTSGKIGPLQYRLRRYKVAARTTNKNMLAARRLNSAAKAWSAAIGVGFRRSTPPQPTSASYTMRMRNRVAWQKVGTVSGCSYSQSTAGATIAAVNLQPDAKMLKVRWTGGGDDSYPYLWLRDNCQCTKCFHRSSLSRSVMLKDLSLSLNCADVKVSDGGEQVKMQWTNGHLGTYDAQWLHERAFREPRHKPRSQECRLQKKYWGHELQDNVPRASFTELLQSDSALLAFLEDLEILGVVLVSDVPAEVDQLLLLTNHIGHMKITHYGTTFDVVDRHDPNNLAYTGGSLDLHSDMPYLQNKPGIQLLHCIKQFSGEGGDSQLADGFAAALKLSTINPKYYETLSQTMVDFVDVGIEGGKKFHASWRAPVIELDGEGTIKNINWNQMTRDSHFGVPLQAAELWYEANLVFRDIIHDENSLITRKLQPGDLLVFDNLRILHGRTRYNAMQGERVLQGCYWEWDTVSSLRRVLRGEMAT
ncbi:gamma-butyrobetaine dioxygenase-like isoform X1 [Scylla paramamosain]|uniref:gamma-butyrobetaine dioxygenase-like isoform X1 n=2 Tax=Scylla paramamosain TaxID=85552 RepID=UPI0030832F98